MSTLWKNACWIGPEIQALLDNLEATVCLVTTSWGIQSSCFYGGGAWKNLASLTSHMEQAELCFVVESGDVQEASDTYGIKPSAPQFHPSVRARRDRRALARWRQTEAEVCGTVQDVSLA